MSYQIISNHIKSNQIKSNQIKSNHIISNQVKTNQIKSNYMVDWCIISNRITNRKFKRNAFIMNSSSTIIDLFDLKRSIIAYFIYQSISMVNKISNRVNNFWNWIFFRIYWFVMRLLIFLGSKIISGNFSIFFSLKLSLCGCSLSSYFKYIRMNKYTLSNVCSVSLEIVLKENYLFSS